MSNEKVMYWRNKDGKIQCPGDSCPAKCDNNCPVWLNQKGSELLKLQDYLHAIQYFKQAVAICSFYIDALNNMGIAYRHLGKYDEAKKCHMKALVRDVRCKKTLYELEYTCRCLKDFGNAQRFQNMLVEICIEEERERLEKFRRNYRVK